MSKKPPKFVSAAKAMELAGGAAQLALLVAEIDPKTPIKANAIHQWPRSKSGRVPLVHAVIVARALGISPAALQPGFKWS